MMCKEWTIHSHGVWFIQLCVSNDIDFDCKNQISHYIDEAQLIIRDPKSGYTGGRFFWQ